MRGSVVLSLCFLFFISSPALADFYRWIDKDGNEFFTNDQKQIPPEYRADAAVVKPGERRVSVAETPGVKVRPGAPLTEHKDRFGRGERYWRGKAAKIRTKLRKQQIEYDRIVKRLNELQSKQPAGARNASRSGLEKKKRKLEEDIAETRRMLDVDLADEARRADAYPGWIRE